MADPVSIAIGTAVSTLATVASSAVSAAGQEQAGRAQAAADERNAQIDRINAGTQAATAEANVQRQQEANQRRVAQGVNAAASSGVDVSSGSPLNVMGDIAAEGALDEQITRWKGAQSVNAYLQQAGNADFASQQATTAADTGAATTLLTGAVRAGSAYLPARPIT